VDAEDDPGGEAAGPSPAQAEDDADPEARGASASVSSIATIRWAKAMTSAVEVVLRTVKASASSFVTTPSGS
jgi:hypothetical protein